MLAELIRTAASLLGYPLRPVPMIAILAFAAGFSLAIAAGMFGLPLLLALTIWFAKYVFVVLVSSAQGQRDPPVLTIEMINPVNEPAPLLLVALLIIAAGIWQFVGGALGAGAQLLFLGFFVLLLPSSIALLAIEQRLLPALDPLRMLRLAAALRWRYALLWIAVAGSVALPGLAPRMIDDTFPALAASLYTLLLCAHAFGRVLYNGRELIGLDVEVDPDRALERRTAERRRRLERVLDEVWRHVRQDKLRAGYAALLTGLEQEAVTAPERLAMHQRLLGWDDSSLGLAHARDCLGGLVRAGEMATAWRMCADCLRIDPRFKPAHAEAAFALGKYALETGDRNPALLLLEDFDAFYDGRGPTQAAGLLAVRELLERRSDTERAGRLIGRLRERFGAAGLRPELSACARLIGERGAPPDDAGAQ